MIQNIWQKSLSALTIAALSAPVIMPAVHAQTGGAITGQTRCAKQSTAIFAQRSAASPVIRALSENQPVTLAENTAEGGFIAVSAPVRGFIQTVTLRLCPGSNPNPNPNPNPSPNPNATCRRVTQSQGLIVRQSGNVSAPVVGSVANNAQVFLTTNPATTSVDSTGRIWVRIAKPVSGWISNGFQNVPGTNLVNCQ
ncbi:SH3 domain-containing protein [Pseudanabaenaceae cyanobacterium LEGE 13415]|nr:SH3 domain-containing protein [Pseudanabaenaceae cyanobacterium LEGE 13415]